VADAASCCDRKGPDTIQGGSDEHERLFDHGSNILLLI